MARVILVVNTGSSSLKLRILDEDDEVVAERQVEGWDGEDVGPVGEILAGAREVGPVDAVGHRVVHGGPDLHGPTVIDDGVVQRLRELVPLAPLHQERSLAGIAAARAVCPEVTHVACFDTAYHADMPVAAATYALPAAWRQRWPLRRFGFHGLSHAYAARRAAELLDRSDDADLRVVSCHLGSGASVCASRGGRSQDTTMGFTPLEGVVMGTRAGSVDPGLVLWLVTEAGLPADVVHNELEHGSGLAGLAGTADMRQVLERAAEGDGAARLACAVYVHVLVRHVAGMAAAVGGLDALVFTGGVGERATPIRAEVVERLGFLGLALDADRNAGATGPDQPDRDVGAPDARARTLVVSAREDLEIARQVRSVDRRR